MPPMQGRAYKRGDADRRARERDPPRDRAPAPAADAAESAKVTADNFTRAETDAHFAKIVGQAGGTGRFFHRREVEAVDKQIQTLSSRQTTVRPSGCSTRSTPPRNQAASLPIARESEQSSNHGNDPSRLR